MHCFEWKYMIFFITISLKFVPKGLINYIPTLVLIMAWRRSGDKPLSYSMLVSLPTHICVSQPQWVILDTVSQNCHFNAGLHGCIITCTAYMYFVSPQWQQFSCKKNMTRLFGMRVYEMYWSARFAKSNPVIGHWYTQSHGWYVNLIAPSVWAGYCNNSRSREDTRSCQWRN